tara:strand:+ start:416 stop:853 length:438 start_codon:yes stop_codon:yes gene_type:complete
MDIVAEAKKQPIKRSSEIGKAIKILEEKGFNSRDIAKFLNEHDIKINHTTVYRQMSGRNKGQKVYFFNNVGDFEKVIRNFPPQARDLARIMRLDTETEWSEPQLELLFENAKTEGELITRQSSWRIFTYYRKKLMGAGIISLTRR